MPKLRSTYDGRLIYKTSDKERTAFLRYDSNGTNGCVCVFVSSTVFGQFFVPEVCPRRPLRPRLRDVRSSRLEPSAVWRHHVAIADRLQTTAQHTALQSLVRSLAVWLLFLTRMTVAEFYFLLLSALEVFWLHGTIIIFVFNNNNNNPGDLYYLGNN